MAAFCNILDEFLTFLFYLSITFAPVTGVIVMDYYFSRRSVYNNHNPTLSHDLPEYRPEALLAWTVGISVAFLGLTGIAALDAFIAASVSYFVVIHLFRRLRP